MSVWDSLIGAGGSILSSLVGGSLQHQENKTLYHNQVNLLHDVQDYNTQMWNMTNEYNSPDNQLSRLTGAGLNPNLAASLIAGSGNATQVASSSAPSASTSGSVAGAAMQGLSVFSQFLQSMANVKNVEAQTQGQEIQNELNAKELSAKDDFINLTKEQMSVNIRNVLASADLSNAQKYKLEYEANELMPVMKEKTLEERNKISQDILLGVQELANAVRTGQLLGEKINTERASQSQIYEQIRGQKFDNTVRELHARLAETYGIDINSSALSLLTELSLAGSDVGQKVVQQIVDTFTGAAVGTAENFVTRPFRALYNSAPVQSFIKFDKNVNGAMNSFLNSFVNSGSTFQSVLNRSGSFPHFR